MHWQQCITLAAFRSGCPVSSTPPALEAWGRALAASSTPPMHWRLGFYCSACNDTLLCTFLCRRIHGWGSGGRWVEAPPSSPHGGRAPYSTFCIRGNTPSRGGATAKEEHAHDTAVLSRPISHGLCKTPHFEHLTRSQPTKQLRSSHKMRMIGCFVRKKRSCIT